MKPTRFPHGEYQYKNILCQEKKCKNKIIPIGVKSFLEVHLMNTGKYNLRYTNELLVRGKNKHSISQNLDSLIGRKNQKLIKFLFMMDKSAREARLFKEDRILVCEEHSALNKLNS